MGVGEPESEGIEGALNSQARRHQAKGGGDYRPSYNRSIANNYNDSVSEEDQINFLRELSRQKKCRYVVSGAINFNDSVALNLRRSLMLYDS